MMGASIHSVSRSVKLDGLVPNNKGEKLGVSSIFRYIEINRTPE